MEDYSSFLHQLYAPGGAKGLAALKNAHNTHPDEWANRNPYTMVSILKHSWLVNLPDLGTWVVEHIPSPMSNFPSLLVESLGYTNTSVTNFLLTQFKEFTDQNIDAEKAQRIGLNAAIVAAEGGKLKYLVEITQIMRNHLIQEQFERIAAHGAAHTDVVQYLWNDLSEPGKIHVAGMVVNANNTTLIKWVAQQIPSDHWADIECNLDDEEKTIWRDHTARVQRTRLENHTQPTTFSTPPKKI